MAFAYLDMGWQDLQGLALGTTAISTRTDRDQYVGDLRRLPRVEGLGWHVIRTIAETGHTMSCAGFKNSSAAADRDRQMVRSFSCSSADIAFRRGEGEAALADVGRQSLHAVHEVAVEQIGLAGTRSAPAG